MQIETYEVEELREEPASEVEAEAAQLIDDLGLKGQKSLIERSRSEDGGGRFPYRQMTTEEHVAYNVLLPVETPIEDYDAGPIPLRILQVAAHAKDQCKIVVWHPRHGVDPLLVGKTGKDYAWKYWLLARWGEVLLPYAQVLEAAKKKLREDFKAKLEETIATSQCHLASLDALVLRKLRGDWVGV